MSEESSVYVVGAGSLVDEGGSESPVGFGGNVASPVIPRDVMVLKAVSSAIQLVDLSSADRGEFPGRGEFSDGFERTLTECHQRAFDSACEFLREYFDGAKREFVREAIGGRGTGSGTEGGADTEQSYPWGH